MAAVIGPLVAVVLPLLVACGPRAPAATATPVQRWLAAPLAYVAHRGGDADWPEGSPLAYRQAAAWNPSLALEVPVRRTADGQWVVTEDATTGRVFGTDLPVATSTWAQLAPLRSLRGGQPLARLREDVLDVVGAGRVLLVDDKADADVAGLLTLLDDHGGARRAVIKSYGREKATPPAAHARGYRTWGYYYPADMAAFDATRGRFDLLALSWSAPAADWARALATHERVFGFVVATPDQARTARAAGATGLMVSGVTQVVPHG